MSLVQWLIPLQYTQMSHFIISVVLDIYRDVGGARKAVLNHGYEITIIIIIVLLLYTYCNRLYDFLVS